MSTSPPLLSLLCLSLLGAAQPTLAAQADACRPLDAAAEEFILRMPFEVVDGRIYVQAEVNGRGLFRFAIDTGASGIGRADTTLVDALGLTAQGRTSTSDGVQAAAVDTVRLDSLRLGGLAKQGVEVITRDYSSRMRPDARLHGIIARDFFADGLLVLDYPRKTLSFSRTLSLPAVGKGVIGYERAFRVLVSIGGVAAEANLDSGANIGFLMPKAMYAQVSQAPLEPAGAGTLTNTRIETWRGRVPGPVRIGEANLADVEVRVADRFPEMLVGAHVLQHYAVLIDQRAQRIALCAR